MSNIVAIVGRPNVGKSTFFNRLVEKREAIIDEISGVTRDRHYGKSVWNGKSFSVIDTGGYIKGSEDVFEEAIRKQVELAVEEAQVILFFVDVTSGLTDLDKEIAKLLRRSAKVFLLVVNKVDNYKRIDEASEFYAMGVEKYYCISSINGSGSGDLLDKLTELLPDSDNDWEQGDELPRFAVIGRPNVGKSSFINALLGEERVMVTDIAGTTRDAIHTRYNLFGHDFFIVDTAGVRKKGKVKEKLEFYSVLRSISTIENSDICFLIIDATVGFDSQDVNLFYLAQKNKKGIVILVNKWDLVEKETHTTKQFSEIIHEKIAPFTDIPIVFISALNKQRIMKAIETGMEVFNNRKQKITTSVLNDILLPIIQSYPPPATKGKHIKIKYITQLAVKSPTFAFFCNLPQYIKPPYKRFLENKIRANFNFNGVSLQLFFRKK